MPKHFRMEPDARTVVLPAATGTLQLIVSRRAEVAVVTVVDSRLEARNAWACKRYLRTLAAEGYRALIVDVSSVTFADTSGVGAVFAALKPFGRAEKLFLVNTQPSVRATLQLIGLDHTMMVAKSVDEALNRLHASDVLV